MKVNYAVAAAAAVFIACLGITALRADQPGADDARIKAGLDFARTQHIPLNLNHRNRDQAGLGAYLVNAVGGCNDCHTAPSYSSDPFIGLGAAKQVNVPCYLAGGQAFGPFVSRDITPWENGMPAGLTFKQFLHVIRTGEDPDNPGTVLQVMPWATYQAMTDSDLRAIYEFLSSIPAINANACGVPSE